MFYNAMYGSSFWETAATQNCGHPKGILLTSLAWTCIFSSLLAWMSLQGNQMSKSCVQIICSLRQRGLSIRIANPTRFSAGFLRNWQLGSAITMGRSWAYPPRVPQVDDRGVECHPGKQPGPQPGRQRTALDILLHSV